MKRKSTQVLIILLIGILSACLSGCDFFSTIKESIPFLNRPRTEIPDKPIECYHEFDSMGYCTKCGATVPVTEALTYTLVGDAYYVSGCTDKEQYYITIPDTYKGKPVVGISERAFRYHRDLVSINLPLSVTTIGVNAFEGCKRLITVAVPYVEGAKQGPVSEVGIGEEAFSGCLLLSSIAISPGVTAIGKRAFFNTHIEDIRLPEGVRTIGDNAFEYCTQLKSVAFPRSLTHVGEEAFKQCYSLGVLDLPSGVQSIGVDAFSDCSALYSINVDPANTVYRSSGNCLIHLPSSTLILGCNASSIPSDMGITTIGARAFAKCSFPMANIPHGVTHIEKSAFENCSQLSTLRLPATLTTLGEFAFSNCTSLASITLPESLASIEQGAFWGCWTLMGITIPRATQSIAYGAFSGCASLDSLSVAYGNTVYHSAGNCIIDTAEKTIVVGCKASAIPSDGSVTRIGPYAFDQHSRLTKIVIPEGVTHIEHHAFSSCNGLTEVSVPSTMLSIGENAFYYCYRIEKFNYNGTAVQWSAIEKGENWDRESIKYVVNSR